ncbi:MAG: bifunctional diguanylate cyclase/phosphodiesterase [Alphaproteobacteria bacterium]|nr:bifunctional diguanylate cyclase/phosphodiesterase [Alphaproteobacteria bacterium]MBU1561656.1 bifunctional diguanylate cyclase/phosphodiesterase [Alphaproteobacteria bacterium]MBU2302363.1 bifunctional diguanylate cyclase/phosphodiesterase [Alphaproteobacteria bacterium]
MQVPGNHHSRLSATVVLLSVMLTIALATLGWWAAVKIDDRSIARETKALRTGLAELLDRIPHEQDSSVVWTEAVVNVRAGNDQWIAENLAEWLSDYFGHDRVYLIDPDGEPIRAVERGQRVSLLAYERDRAAIGPMIAELRRKMAVASVENADDATDALVGTGMEDVRTLSPDATGIVSVRPILPSDDTLVQAIGDVFLHVSVVELDQDTAAAIGQKFDVADLRFAQGAVLDSERIANPVLDSAGRIVGFFHWLPDEPAYQLILETAPLLAGTALFLVLAGTLLFLRLQSTTERLETTQAHATFLAYHDSLTRLPNRAMFEHKLSQSLGDARRNNSQVVLHCIDLDHFKSVNDTFGHAAGDALLLQVSHRLGSLVGEGDLVARLGGDEFAIIQPNVSDMRDALGLAQSVVSALEQSFDIDGHEIEVSTSVGLMSSDGHVEMEDLLRQADLALYEAKGGGRNRYMLYAGELGTLLRDRLELESELREALKSRQGLELVYQPIYCIRENRILGAEALVRWQHPKRGRLSPDMFIKLAEERGLINQLGHWVLQEACRFAVKSQLPWIAVNVSPIQFRDERFAERVFGTLDATGLDAARLEIEVTEGLLLQNSPEVQHTLRVLRGRGIRVALDDFGTGYSSISYLRTYGVDKLKIDQSFTAQLGQDEEIDSIVRSIIDLGRAMKMQLTAEGVETESQRSILIAMGCDQLQGYLLSRPVSDQVMLDLLSADAQREDNVLGRQAV